MNTDGHYPPVVLIGWDELERFRRSGSAQPADRDDLPATMSVTQAAQYLGISRSHAYDLVRSGELPHVRLRRRILIPRRELDALIHAPKDRTA